MFSSPADARAFELHFLTGLPSWLLLRWRPSKMLLLDEQNRCFSLAQLIQKGVLYRAAIRTAIMPLRNTPSKVPAPPMLANGAPSLGMARKFARSAPMSVPRTPET